MQKYKKPKFNSNDIGNNPFAVSLVIPVRTLVFDNKYKQDKDGDWLNATTDAEYTEHARFYCSSERRLIISRIRNLRSKELLLWIIQEIKYGEDYIWINKKRYMEEVEVSSIDTYKAALKDLIRYGLLTATIITDVYWINPDFFFKGDRIKKYPNNIVKK